MNKIILHPSAFNQMKDTLKPMIKDRCDFCKTIIKKDTFGLLSKDHTVCQSTMCLIEYFDEVNK